MDLPTLIDTTEFFFSKYGYLTIFVGSFIEITPMGWMVPGGVILALAGFFANGSQEINLVSIILYGTFGAWITFTLSYLLGKKSGMWLVKKLKQEKNATFAKRLLANHGGVILTTSMLANLTRFWVAYIAGVENYDFKKFSLYSFAAAVGWSSLMAIIGYLAGFERNHLEKAIGATGVVGWVFLGLAAYFIQRSIKHEYKHFKEDLPHTEKV